MNTRCEEVVSAMATGGPIRRWRARRHVARCPRCAEARNELRQIAEALAEVPPLTVAQRRLWVAAAGDVITAEPSRVSWLRPALAGAFAAAVIAVVGVWWAFRPVNHRPGLPPVTRVSPPAAREEAVGDVESLRGSVMALARELDDLRSRADLLDARKEVDALMARLASRGGSSGL
jgi:hypothetical protein